MSAPIARDRAVSTIGRLLPVYPQLQICRCTARSDAKCQKRSIANFHLSQIQIASGQDPHPGELTSALSRRGHLEATDTQSVSDRSRSRSTALYDSPSTAHLNGLPAPAMRGVHASVNHIATAVVSVVVVIVVVRVVAVAESEAVAPEVAIMKPTAVKFATTKSTSVETTARMESTTHAATMESTGNAAATETASPEAAPME